MGPRIGFHLLLPVYPFPWPSSNSEGTCDTLYLVDVDPQASLTKYFLDDAFKQLPLTMYHGLVEGKRIPPLKIREGLHFLPARNEDIPLTQAEVELPQKYRFDFQQRLGKLLAQYPDYDYLLIDTPGNVSIFTVLSLAAANIAIIPVKSEKAAEQATDDIMETIEQVRGTSEEPGLNPKLIIWGILPTLYESHVNHHKQVIEQLVKKYGDLVYTEPSRKTNDYNNAHVIKGSVGEISQDLGQYWQRIAKSVIAKGA